jgi:hypothetical protein
MKFLRITFIVLFIGTISLSGAFAKDKAKKPSVMVLINEQIWVDENIIYDYYGSLAEAANLWTSVSQTDTTFIAALLKRGFTVVGSGLPAETDGSVNKTEILMAIDGDDLESIVLANRLKADIVIVGKAVAKGVEMLSYSRQKSARANITVRAIDVDTGQIIAAETGNATAVAIDEISAGVEAIKKATKPLARNIINKILKNK